MTSRHKSTRRRFVLAACLLTVGTAASASFPLDLIALFLFSAAFGRHPRRRRGHSLILSSVAAAALAGFLFAFLSDRAPGVAERLALASFLAWELWVASALARPARLEDERSAAAPGRSTNLRMHI